jgi:surfactin synthase thioesterase subunit/aryl carrier-like protein
MDWRRWCASHANGAGPRLAALGQTQVHAGVPATWEQALREAPPERRLACILEGLVVRVARVLGTTPQSLGPGSSLGEFGLDSLMAVELRNRLRQDLGLDLPTLVFLQGPTLSTLAKTIEERLFAGPARAPAMAAREVSRDEWFHRPSPRDAAELRLFCFPYNGGGVSTYASWASELPFADVVTLELPGSRDRLDEAPARSWDHLVEQTAAAMEPLMDRPFALYGHSLGGLLAFEVARALEDKGYPPALGLFIGAFPAPMLPSPFPPDASRLLDASDHPLASLDDSGLKDVILRALCAGIEVYGSYRFDSRRKLSCPLVALCGDRDDLVRPDYMLPWEQLTRRGFGLEILRGGHLFVDTARAATLDVLQKYLRTIFRPEGAKNEPDHA